MWIYLPDHGLMFNLLMYIDYKLIVATHVVHGKINHCFNFGCVNLQYLYDRVAVMSKVMVGLKCALVGIGAQSAMTFGRIRMQVLHVSSWDSLSTVS